MKVSVRKLPGGAFAPATDEDAEKLTSFKTGEVYEAQFSLARNPRFHRKAMAFFHFCFEHWDGEKVYEHCSPAQQFDRFRKDLTILAGFYIQTVRLDGSLRTEAESLSFGSMTEDRFRECYTALVSAAMKHIFKSADDDDGVFQQLMRFF